MLVCFRGSQQRLPRNFGRGASGFKASFISQLLYPVHFPPQPTPGTALALRRLRSRIRSFDGCKAKFRPCLRTCKIKPAKIKPARQNQKIPLANFSWRGSLMLRTEMSRTR
jgi:hypothetical protein